MALEVEELIKVFKGHNIPLSAEWLESCIEWCKDGNLPPNYTLKDLQAMVYQQWLDQDLRDLEVSSLPRNLSTEKKFILSGNYALQMMQIVDISKPKLWQLQRIRNNVAKNTDAEKDFGKRVLLLTLTDGVQEVEAMEFKPIPCLNLNLEPGCKIRINGPVIIRNGRIMLENQHVKILGGSIEDLAIKNAVENVLARALKLEENPNPRSVDENVLSIVEDNSRTQSNVTNLQQVRTTQNQNLNYPNQSRNIAIPNRSNTLTSNSNANCNKNVQDYEINDDILRELQSEFNENSNDFNTYTKNVKSKDQNDRSSSPDLFEEMEWDDELLNEHLNQIDVDNIDLDVKYARSNRNFSTNTTRQLPSGSDNKSKVNIRNQGIIQDVNITSTENVSNTELQDNEVIPIDDSFDDIDIDSHLDKVDAEMAQLPSSTQIPNILQSKVGSPELKKPHTKSLKLLNRYNNLEQTNFSKIETEIIHSPNSTQVFNCLDSKTGSPELKKPKLSLRPSRRVIDLDSSDSELKNFTLGTNKLVQNTLKFQQSDSDLRNLPSTSKMSSKPLSGSNLHLPGNRQSPEDRLKPPILEQDWNNKVLTNRPSNTDPKIDLSSPETDSLSKKVKISKANILSIEKLKKMQPNIGIGKFKIKAKFVEVIEKVIIKNLKYHLVIKVEDLTGDISVQVCSDVVSRLADCPPDKMESFRELAFQRDRNVERQIAEILTRLMMNLSALNDVLEIQITRGEKYPLLVGIFNG